MVDVDVADVKVVVSRAVAVVTLVVVEVVVAVVVVVMSEVTTTVVGVRKALQKVLAWAATSSIHPFSRSLLGQRPTRKPRASDRHTASQDGEGWAFPRAVTVVKPTKATAVARSDWWNMVMMMAGIRMNDWADGDITEKKPPKFKDAREMLFSRCTISTISIVRQWCRQIRGCGVPYRPTRVYFYGHYHTTLA
jgi:hypothetical protein